MASIPRTSTLLKRRSVSWTPDSVAPQAKPKGERVAIVEAGRGIAACCIVAHHLSAYGEAPDLAAEVAPGLMSFLYDYARMAVYVFLVFGGYSMGTAQPTSKASWSTATATFFWRYLRLVVPYGAMIAMLLGVAWWTSGRTMDPPVIDSFSWPQLFSHVFFLQDLLGYGNLSAGTWYLCIDIQFALLFLVLLAVASSVSRKTLKRISISTLLIAILAPLGIWSAWHVNRDPANDKVVFYYLAPLVLGVLVAWWQRSLCPSLVLLGYALLLTASLIIDFRPRLGLAMVTALLLVVALQMPSTRRVPRPLVFLGRISYSLFLIHYLVNWIVMSALRPFYDADPWRALCAIFIAFSCSLGAAVVFYRVIERPFQNWAHRHQTA